MSDSGLPVTPNANGGPGSALDIANSHAGQIVTPLQNIVLKLGQLLQQISGGTPPTQQNLIAGSGATYTTPAGATRLMIRMVGGGGGGAGSGTASLGAGGNGGDTSFNAIVAAHGLGAATNGQGGVGGSAGAGSASLRCPGSGGITGQTSAAGAASAPVGGKGGDSLLGAGTQYGNVPAANSGGGGAGADGQSGTSVIAGGGGGAGEYVELQINNPAGSYTFSIGAGGTAGTAGTGGNAGRAGGSGNILVAEFYG